MGYEWNAEKEETLDSIELTPPYYSLNDIKYTEAYQELNARMRIRDGNLIKIARVSGSFDCERDGLVSLVLGWDRYSEARAKRHPTKREL